MAKENHINIPAHYNIYTGENSNRNLDIYFSEPENGVNNDTGLLLLIPGFGGNSQSNVYKKMRLEFADKHNLIVIQCDYFGSAFMQTPNKVNLSFDINDYKKLLSQVDYHLLQKELGNFNTIIKILSKYPCILHATASLEEDERVFNDMGFMQALDLLTALYAVKLIIKDNGLSYNEEKVIAYGHSHGAYLAYLCNRMAPDDFTLIIDNSAWLKPGYLTSSRFLNQRYGEMILQTRFDYFASKFDYDKDILSLPKLYNGFDNKAVILSYQGEADSLVNYKEKEEFCMEVNNANFHLIDENQVDKIKYFSNGHGLNADFLEHFNYVMENTKFKLINNGKDVKNTLIEIINDDLTYVIDYQRGLPVMSVKD